MNRGKAQASKFFSTLILFGLLAAMASACDMANAVWHSAEETAIGLQSADVQQPVAATGDDVVAATDLAPAPNSAPELTADSPPASPPASPADSASDSEPDPGSCGDLHSKQAILIRLPDSAVMCETSGTEQVYPASLTKMMTAIVAIEYLEAQDELEQLLLLPESMFDALYKANASRAGFLPNEQAPAIDLLYGTMLPSGADAAIALATHIAGSEKKFVQLMNEKAEALGMADTHFSNATGLHHNRHYSTVRDLALLAQYALQDETFRALLTAKRHSTASTNLHADGITFYSSLFQRIDEAGLEAGSIIGGKTGYTGEAGLCLASIAAIGGTEYLLITTGAEGDTRSEPFHILDALQVFQSL